MPSLKPAAGPPSSHVEPDANGFYWYFNLKNWLE